MKLLIALLLLASPVYAQDTITISPKAIDYIFELAQDRYADIPKGDCLVQQMCVSEGSEVKCFEFYIFNDGSVAMMPWNE